MHTYRKRFVSPDGECVIEQLRDDGTIRAVNRYHHGYIEWCDAGNVPEEIPYTPAPPSLDVLKGMKRAEIAAARYAAEVAGTTLGGISVRTDRESQSMITGAALKAMQDASYACKWKGLDGWVTLDAAAILAVADAVRSHVQGCFDREAELSAAIDAAETVEAVEAVTWGG